jgi:D-alanyl-lipoteichoic acid acyltransferase DltB (MBOAT superfamily)
VGLIAFGLLRKFVIADPLLRAVPATAFQAPGEVSPLALAAWLAAYAVGVYNDFCGYTDLVRGVSGLFAIDLSRNFNLPFFSRNFTELWNRWHMTLCFWLRDYVYFPISRALVRRGTRLSQGLNLILPAMAATLASGLWHGCNVKFIAWGVLMGLLLVAERLAALGRPLRPVTAVPAWQKSLSVLKLWALAGLLALFSAAEPGPALEFLSRLFSSAPWHWPDSRVFLLVLPSAWLDFRQLRTGDELFFLRYPPLRRAAFLALAGWAIFLFSRSGIPAPFVYQGF